MDYLKQLPSSFASLLKGLRLKAGYASQKDFAAAVGVHPNTQRNYEDEGFNRLPDIDYLIKVSRLTSCNLMEVLILRVYFQCSHEGEVPQDIQAFINGDIELLNSANVLEVKSNEYEFVLSGTAMEPLIQDGMICEYIPTTGIENGAIHAFSTGDSIVVRRAEVDLDGDVILTAANKDFSKLPLSQARNLKLLGRVVSAKKRF